VFCDPVEKRSIDTNEPSLTIIPLSLVIGYVITLQTIDVAATVVTHLMCCPKIRLILDAIFAILTNLISFNVKQIV
jgi:hypothetical protein